MDLNGEPTRFKKRNISATIVANVRRFCHQINTDEVSGTHSGRAAIDKVMRTQPAAFLKLLVLLVPREMKVEHSGGVKAMSDEQLEAGIEAIQAMLAARDAGANAKVIEAAEESPSPGELEGPTPRRTRRKATRDMGRDTGSAPDEAIS